jgi:hypothetical protein
MLLRFLRRAVVDHPRLGQILVGPEVGHGTSDGLGWHGGDVIEMPDDTVLGSYMERVDTGERGVAPPASGHDRNPEIRIGAATSNRALPIAAPTMARSITQGGMEARGR